MHDYLQHLDIAFIGWPVIYVTFREISLWSLNIRLFSLMMLWNVYIFRKGSMFSWKILSFLFAIQEINQDLQLLTNISLGYNLHENHFNSIMTLDALLDLLSTGEANIPNYRCGSHNRPLVVFDGSNADISIQISNMLGIYKIPQVCARVGGVLLLLWIFHEIKGQLFIIETIRLIQLEWF